MKYQTINRCRPCFAVSMMCRNLSVSSSGFYDWLKRPVSQRDQENHALLGKIKKLHESSDGVWGAPAITEELNMAGIQCSLNRVARLMKLANIKGIPQKRQWYRKPSSVRPDDIVNHLKRNFKSTRANQKWSTDITYIKTDEGYLYACIIKDLFDGRVVGWSTSSRQTRDMVLQAVLMALWQRPKNGSVILHSDRGTQFTSTEYQEFLKGHNITCSMSAVGSCADNATAESFFGQMKRERINRRKYLTRNEARSDVFDYIERFYNPRKKRQLEMKQRKQLHLTKLSGNSG